MYFSWVPSERYEMCVPFLTCSVTCSDSQLGPLITVHRGTTGNNHVRGCSESHLRYQQKCLAVFFIYFDNIPYLLYQTRWRHVWVCVCELKVKVKLSLCLTKHHAIKTYWGAEIELHEFFTSPLDGGKWSAWLSGHFVCVYISMINVYTLGNLSVEFKT